MTNATQKCVDKLNSGADVKMLNMTAVSRFAAIDKEHHGSGENGQNFSMTMCKLVADVQIRSISMQIKFNDTGGRTIGRVNHTAS